MTEDTTPLETAPSEPNLPEVPTALPESQNGKQSLQPPPPAGDMDNLASRIQVMRNNRNQRLILICTFQTRMFEKDKERCSLLVKRMLDAFQQAEREISLMMDHQVMEEWRNLADMFQAKPRFSPQ